jgi:hypothetical protein
LPTLSAANLKAVLDLREREMAISTFQHLRKRKKDLRQQENPRSCAGRPENRISPTLLAAVLHHTVK